ncbi:MAG: hypothetical protein WC919_01130, partial [Candidatus Paceibacterota bacterium]
NHMADRLEGRWFWCELCNCPAIKCEKCGNSSCNGSGCAECHNDFEEVALLFIEHKVPKKDGLPVHQSPKI